MPDYILLGELVNVKEEIRFSMTDNKLWRFPPRFGSCSIVSAELNRPIRFVTQIGSETIDRSTEAKCEAQAARADLGMCLIDVWLPGDQMGDCWLDGREASDV